jgi:hypothetical protein
MTLAGGPLLRGKKRAPVLVEVYGLRWIAGQTAGIPEFDPLYTIT